MYTMSSVVVIDVRGIDHLDLYGLEEFLRVNMISPILKSSGMNEPRKGGEPKTAYFSAGFTKSQAEKVGRWLTERGIKQEEAPRC